MRHQSRYAPTWPLMGLPAAGSGAAARAGSRRLRQSAFFLFLRARTSGYGYDGILLRLAGALRFGG